PGAKVFRRLYCEDNCNMQRKIQPDVTRLSSTGKSCLECRRRKIKCDKALPCSYCVKVKVRCAYPPRKGVSRNDSQDLPDQELGTRVETIERTLISCEESLSQIWQVVQTTRPQPPYLSSNKSNHPATSDVRELQASPARPYQGRHRDFACRGYAVHTSQSLHPSSTTTFFLWQTYLERVHPVLKIIHAPCVQRQIIEFLQEVISDSSPIHCLLFAIYYTAVVALTTEECKKALGCDRPTSLQRYRKSIETALTQADYQKSTDITVLQAFTLYTVCGRFDAQGPDIKSLTRVAITIAFENGLNDENSNPNIAPFEAEMRRRLWWQIFILDVRMAEDDRSEPHILESQFHNKFPSNVSDADLNPDMSYIPENHPAKSEMLFSLVRLEVSYFTRLVSFSDQFTGKNSYPTMSTSEKCEAIDRFEERMEREYLSHCDTSIPLDFVTAESSRLILAKLRLTMSKPRNRESQQVLIQDSFRQNCVEILDRSKAMRLHERGGLWRWLFQSYIEWDVLTYLFISLSLSPLGHMADAAFAAAEDIYQYWNGRSDSRGCSRWTRIKEFHAQTLVAREMALVNPSLFGISSDGTDQLEDCESMAMGSHESITSTATQPGVSGPIISSEIRVSPLVGRPESSMEPEQRFAQMHGHHNTQISEETSDIPSSGTACQWSTTLFERYFEVLDSEQEGAISWF
ncbi:uncharacterized protein N7446_007700, partial [Penicillium canescens]